MGTETPNGQLMINKKLTFAFIGCILCRFCFSVLFLSALLVIHTAIPATTNGVLEVFSHVIFHSHLVGTIGHHSKAIVGATGIIEIQGQIGWVFFFQLMNSYVIETT